MDEKLSKAIAEEIEKEENDKAMAEFKPKPISKAQVKGAKIAWMAVATAIDLTTAYALYWVFAPYWWYAAMWIFAGVGGLIFAEWLWERVGNNDDQERIAKTSKNVSAVAIILMAALAGVALVLGMTRAPWMEVSAFIAVVGLVGFHGLQAYQYHEKDDDYIAETYEARQNAQNEKELRQIHRAGKRVEAKGRVHQAGQKYQREQGQAFVKSAGRTFAQTAKDETDFTKGAGEK